MTSMDFKRMLLGLDQLFMAGKKCSQEQAQMYAEAIDQYLADSNYTWDDIIEQMAREGRDDN